jgi:histidyl-tRNA synthetase
MKLSTQPYKGTRDFFPKEMRQRSWIFDRLRRSVQGFGYQEYDGPMLEPFDLYAAKSGEEIVNQQLYWLVDKGERKMAIRPEMTPTLARMVAACMNEAPKPLRWFSIPNLWRYERPQRGRLREHWQLNVDILGGDQRAADLELLELALSIFRAFGGEAFFQIRVNNRRLVDAFFLGRLGLGSEAAKKLARLVDAKDKMEPAAYRTQLDDLGLSASALADLEIFLTSDLAGLRQRFWTPEGSVDMKGTEALASALSEVDELFSGLKAAGLADRVVFDPTIMRGLDYYTGLVFEGFDVSPENRRALFGGGRYDNLVGLFSKQELSGVGFGLGDVTLAQFLETHGLLKEEEMQPFVDVFIGVSEAAHAGGARALARKLREAEGCRPLRVVFSTETSPMKKLLQEALRSGAAYFATVDASEPGLILIKDLAKHEQKTLTPDAALREMVGRYS